MKILRAALAVALSFSLTVEPLFAATTSSATPPVFNIKLPGSLGYVSESYSPEPGSMGKTPDMIFIQDLHSNRSVQFAISGILKKLKSQGLLPKHIGVEGETGPVEVASMQKVSNTAIRKDLSDYLVQQAEMSGAMHFVVTEGAGGLYGIETDEYYKANLEMFQRSYLGRDTLRRDIGNMQAVLPKLMKDDGITGQNAAILEKDLAAVNQLINNQVIPDELPTTLARVSESVDHLKQVLPKETSGRVVESLSASVNFYALALLRNEELFKNSVALHNQEQQKTSIVVTGGFHTAALAEQCKSRGLSYAVITPNVRQHTKIDEALYIERLLDRHLTPAQVVSGRDWASAMTMIMPKLHALRLYMGALRDSNPLNRWPIRSRIVNTAVVVAAGLGLNYANPSVDSTIDTLVGGKPDQTTGDLAAPTVPSVDGLQSNVQSQENVNARAAFQRLGDSKTIISAILAAIGVAVAMSVTGLIETPVYAAELGLGSNAGVTHGVVQAAVHTVTAVADHNQVHQSVLASLQQTLSSIDLKTKVTAGAAIFTVPFMGIVAFKNKILADRLKKKLDAMRNQAAILAAA